MLSKTKIKNRLKNKTNTELAQTIHLSIKNSSWLEIAKILSGSTRLHSSINLSEIDKYAKIGDTVIIPGKVLSKGELSKKIKICALSISEQAKEKLKETKSEYVHLIDEIKKNPKAEGIKVLR